MWIIRYKDLDDPVSLEDPWITVFSQLQGGSWLVPFFPRVCPLGNLFLREGHGLFVSFPKSQLLRTLVGLFLWPVWSEAGWVSIWIAYQSLLTRVSFFFFFQFLLLFIWGLIFSYNHAQQKPNSLEDAYSTLKCLTFLILGKGIVF